MISNLTTDRIPELVPMALAFHEASGFLGDLVPRHWVESWTTLLESGYGFILVDDGDDGGPVGTIGGFLVPDTNDGVLIAHEAFWYVDPSARGSGLDLLNAFLATATHLGAGRAQLSHTQALRPKALGRLYKRMGFQPMDTNYVKELA